MNNFTLLQSYIDLRTFLSFGHVDPSIVHHCPFPKQALTGEVSNIDEVDMSDGDEDMTDEIDNAPLGSEARPREAMTMTGGSTGVVPMGQGKGRNSSSEHEHDR